MTLFNRYQKWWTNAVRNRHLDGEKMASKQFPSLAIAGEDRELNVRPDPPDIRDRFYEPALIKLENKIDNRDPKMVLDQGQEGACTGFGLLDDPARNWADPARLESLIGKAIDEQVELDVENGTQTATIIGIEKTRAAS